MAKASEGQPPQSLYRISTPVIAANRRGTKKVVDQLPPLHEKAQRPPAVRGRCLDMMRRTGALGIRSSTITASLLLALGFALGGGCRRSSLLLPCDKRRITSIALVRVLGAGVIVLWW